MKIVYFTHYFPPAGFAASINTYEIVTRLAKRGHKVVVIGQPSFYKTVTSSPNQDRKWPTNLEVRYALMTPPYLSVTIPHFLNAFKALKYECDLVMTQFHPFHLASFTGLVMKALKKKPWVVRVHDLAPYIPSPIFSKIFHYAWYEAFLNTIGKKANKMLILTNELRRFLERNGYSSRNLGVIPNGVDTKLFSLSTSKAKSNFNKRILYVGAMGLKDGLDRLIKAFALLRHISDLELLLIGDGSMRPSLMELTRKLHLERRVVFKHYIRHELIPEFIRSSYVTVGRLITSPVHSYTIPSKILEYFACGKTVVAAMVSRDILVDGHTGLIVKTPTPENIAERLSVLIEDERLTTRLGRNARKLVVERFDWEKIVDLLEKEIRNC